MLFADDSFVNDSFVGVLRLKRLRDGFPVCDCNPPLQQLLQQFFCVSYTTAKSQDLNDLNVSIAAGSMYSLGR